MIKPISLPDLKAAVRIIAENPQVPEAERAVLVQHVANLIGASNGEAFGKQFLAEFRAIPQIGLLLGQIASTEDRQELNTVIVPVKEMVKKYVSYNYSLSPNIHDLQLPSDIFVLMKTDIAAAVKLGKQAFAELLESVNIKQPVDKAEARELITEINKGVYNTSFHEALDTGAFKAWADRFKVRVKL